MGLQYTMAPNVSVFFFDGREGMPLFSFFYFILFLNGTIRSVFFKTVCVSSKRNLILKIIKSTELLTLVSPLSVMNSVSWLP